MEGNGLCLSDNPRAFFHEKVTQAQERLHKRLPPEVEHYLVELLNGQLRSPESPSPEEGCLALLLQKALESPGSQQVLLYRKLGDTALYISGFFQEFFNRKAFSVGYYISMGESAYGTLASLVKRGQGKEASRVYRELSRFFPQAVDVLTDVSEHTVANGQERGPLGLYEVWMACGSEKARQGLEKKGIVPVPVKRLLQ